MRIPVQYAPILFGALLSAIMVGLVSAFVLSFTQGIHPGFAAQWFKSCLTTWPVAFPTVTLIAPWVRRIVERLTGQTGPLRTQVQAPAPAAMTGSDQRHSDA